MLERVREKASSWMIKFILVVIAFVFVFLGVESYQTGTRSQVAVVNGTVISVDAYRTEYESLVDQIRRQFGGAISPEILAIFQVQEQALQRLIDRQLLIQEAQKQHLQVTDAEVEAFIAAIPAFQTDGKFDSAVYDGTLRANGMNAVLFEEQQRRSLLLEKLQNLILGGVHISKAEALDFYHTQNQQLAMETFIFRPSDFTPDPIEEEALLARYESHKENYRIEPMVKTIYLRFSPDDFRDSLEITEEDLQNAYELRLEDFREPERVEARHILLKLPEEADPELVESRKKEILALRDKILRGAAFSDVAKESSEGPSAPEGGALGIFSREAMVPAFSEVAFTLAEGEMSAPVQTRFGWHLIRVDQRLPEDIKAFESVKETLRTELQEEKARNKSYDLADSAYDAVLSGADLKEVATTLNLSLHETDFFGTKGPESGVMKPSRFAETALTLIDDGVSEPVEIGDALFLISITERKESRIPEIEAVQERMRAALQKETAEAMAQSKAKDVLTAMEKGETTEIEFVETGLFGREDDIPKLGPLPMLSQVAFALDKEKNIPGEPVRLNEGYAVFRIVERSLPDATNFESERQRIEEELKSRKENRMYNQWMTSLREKAEIEVETAYRQEG